MENRRPARLAPLFDGDGVRRILKTAARVVNRRRAVQTVLEQILPAHLAAGSTLGAYDRGRLELEARDELSYAELRSKAPSIERQLKRAVPGIRTLIVRPPGWQPPADEPADAGSEASKE